HRDSAATAAAELPRSSPAPNPRGTVIAAWKVHGAYLDLSVSQLSFIASTTSLGVLVPLSSSSSSIICCIPTSHSWCQPALSCLPGTAFCRPLNSHWKFSLATGGSPHFRIA